MKASLIQMDIEWGNPHANILKAERLMGSTEAGLYVLPEMWATGYSVHPEEIAEDESESVALAWMRTTASKRQCAICGSLAIRDAQGDYRNRLYFITPDAEYYYDKHHLFTYAHEDQNYRPGKQSVVVTYQGVRFLLLVCYDLRFPVWSRWGMAGEYDAIVYVANWPEARQDAWETLIRARAIENQSYVVAVNRVGQQGKALYAGGSALVNPLGKTISACQATECACQAEIDLQALEWQRNDFPVLLDRD